VRNRCLPPSTPVAAVSLLSEGARWCTTSSRVPESPVVPTVIALRGAVGCRGDFLRLASVSGMRALSGAATGQGSDLAGQIHYLLEQALCVGSLCDGCCGGKRSDFRDPVGQL
jgi:hypothetical protein